MPALTIHVYNRPVELTAETIRATWQWFADNRRACATDARTGAVRVNDLPRYLAKCAADATEYDRKAADTSLEGLSVTFVQRAYFIQSGESVPLLS